MYSSGLTALALFRVFLLPLSYYIALGCPRAFGIPSRYAFGVLPLNVSENHRRNREMPLHLTAVLLSQAVGFRRALNALGFFSPVIRPAIRRIYEQLLTEAKIPFVLSQRRNSTRSATWIHLTDHFFYHIWRSKSRMPSTASVLR